MMNNEITIASVIEVEVEEGEPFSLLALPHPLLRELLCRSLDGATVNALLGTCRELRQLYHDPAIAALLLIRLCSRHSAPQALASFAHSHGGASAVVEHALTLLRDGHPCIAACRMRRPRLLQALLHWAAAEGDVPAIQSILALPQPPPLNTQGCKALESALTHGPHLPALAALLDAGADPCGSQNTPLALFTLAAATPERLPALQLLLLHTPDTALSMAVAQALLTAVCHGNLPATTHLLPLMAPTVDLDPLLQTAAQVGDPAVLDLLLVYLPATPNDLFAALLCACASGHTPCVAVLLHRGADVRLCSLPLERAVEAVAVGPAEQTLLVQLLMSHGANVTTDVRAAAERAGAGAEVVALLAGPSGVDAWATAARRAVSARPSAPQTVLALRWTPRTAQRLWRLCFH